MAFVVGEGSAQINNLAHTKPLTVADLDILSASLSARLIKNPKYHFPGNNKLFQTTVVVHGGAVSIKLLKSHEMMFDTILQRIYTIVLLEGRGFEDPIGLLSKEIAAVGKEAGLGDTRINSEGDAADWRC